jgi:predicted  nucleic acid-binding Zn-ribbon protein
MAGPAPLFREIHRLRRHAHNLQEQLDRIPRQRKIHQDRLAKKEQELRDLQEAIKKLKLTAAEREKSLKSKLEQITRYQQQLNDVTGKKEYDALMLEIAAARTACGVLEDEALQALTDADDRAPQIPPIQQGIAAATDELARFEAGVKDRQADLQAQLNQAQKELQAVEAQVPEDLLPQYRRTVASLKHDGMAMVKDRTCTACFTEIIYQAQLDLEHEKFVVCRSCGRILYLPGMASGTGEDE